MLLVLGSAVRGGAHRLDGQAEVGVDLLAQYFLYSVLLLSIAVLRR